MIPTNATPHTEAGPQVYDPRARARLCDSDRLTAAFAAPVEL